MCLASGGSWQGGLGFKIQCGTKPLSYNMCNSKPAKKPWHLLQSLVRSIAAVIKPPYDVSIGLGAIVKVTKGRRGSCIEKYVTDALEKVHLEQTSS